MTFASLGLEPELLHAVAAKGYAEPTPIQSAAIPACLAGEDVLAGAQTGTGKTAAFVLPLLQLLRAPMGRTPRALVLTPTRELAAQIAESVADYGTEKRLRTRVIFGGVGERPQIDGLKQGTDILIATPGRLLDLCDQGYCDLSQIRHFVLDEADRMLDMGFIHAIRRVLKRLPAERQNLLFSATYTPDIRALAAGFLKDPVHIDVAPRNKTAERVEQVAFRVNKEDKRHLLVHLFRHGVGDEGPWNQVLVFTRTKHGANRLAEQLNRAGITAAAIHGNKSQSARVKALADFKSGAVAALVATEVASRGLDIRELPQVVNYELPNVPEDYVHRIGRTARAGASGAAVSLVEQEEAPLLRDIERTMNQRVPFVPTPEFERQAPAPAPAPRPALRPSSGGGPRQSQGRGGPAGSSPGGASRGQGGQNRSGQSRSGQGGQNRSGQGRSGQGAGGRRSSGSVSSR